MNLPVKTRHTIIPAAYILYQPTPGKMLLGLRQNTQYEDGLFSLPAGHVEPKEGPLQAAIRELEEETGLQVQEEELKLVHIAYRKPEGESERIDFFYTCEVDKGSARLMEPDKCLQWQLFDRQQLPQNLSRHVTQLLQALDQGLFFKESACERPSV